MGHWIDYLKLEAPNEGQKIAISSIIRLSHQLGMDDAIDFSRQGLRSERRETRAATSDTIIQTMLHLPAIEKLLVGALGLCTLDRPNITNMVDLAFDNDWTPLRAALTDIGVQNIDDGHSHHARGMLLDSIDCRALAYQSYNRAAELGVAVSKAALARLVFQQGNAGAGLALLKAHTSSFDDAKFQRFPHETRASLEEAIQNEEDKLKPIQEDGVSALALLIAFADQALLLATPSPTPVCTRADLFPVDPSSGQSTSGAGTSVQTNTKPLSIRPLAIIKDAFSIFDGPAPVGVCFTSKSGQTVGLSWKDIQKGMKARWFKLTNPGSPPPGKHLQDTPSQS